MTVESIGKNVERVEITSAGLFALLREDVAGLAAAKATGLKVEQAAKLVRRANQINRIAAAVICDPAVVLESAVQRLG